jgi:hypothetical protein
MQTQAERQFNEDFQAYKQLFRLSGFKGKDKVKSWIQQRGQEAIVQAEKEINSETFKNRFKRQTEFELEELAYLNDEDKE